MKAEARWASGMFWYEHWSRTSEYEWALCNAYLNEDDVVLNAGCGDFKTTPFNRVLVERCIYKELVLLDNKASAIRTLNRLLDDDSFGVVRLVKGDISKLDFPDEYFTKIFCISVVEHTELDLDVYVNEMLRVLRCGGKILLTLDVGTKGASSRAKYNMSNIKSILKKIGVKLPSVTPLTLRSVIDKNTENQVSIQVLCMCITKEK